MYLADSHGAFRFLTCDLDAAKGDARADARALAQLLDDLAIPCVLTRSGPSDGRHVWIGLAEPADADLVRELAHLLRRLCPTLDLSPLTNPATGCVRPPGAPHRAGGRSSLLAGDLDTLLTPRVRLAHLHRLLAALRLRFPAPVPVTSQPREHSGSICTDSSGHPYLPGTRRELPAASRAALVSPVAAGVDGSALLRSVLLGAAAAHWHLSDIAQLADDAPSSPGLEHLRSAAGRPGQPRRPRSAVESGRLLTRQWARAVTHVATTTRHAGDDATFGARAHAVAQLVDDVQARAHATRGRWRLRGGPSLRRVLDVLCELVLEAVTGVVEADIRRIALMCGIGRETARTALLRLAEEGWIRQARPAEGPHAAYWALLSPTGAASPPRRDRDLVGGSLAVEATPAPDEASAQVSGLPAALSTGDPGRSRSQADPAPPGWSPPLLPRPLDSSGAGLRTSLLHLLTARREAQAHPLFTPTGLGHRPGQVWALLRENWPLPTSAVAEELGDSIDTAAADLDCLQEHGLLHHGPRGWLTTDSTMRDHLAAERGIEDLLTDRAARYTLERELWAWWQSEQEWMSAPRRTSGPRRAGAGQLQLLPHHHARPAHPRRSDGRCSWRTARRALLETGPSTGHGSPRARRGDHAPA
ncbi:hypothetical protein CLV92_11934 [Kineococcus xinjiangensis]|uniref:TOTE conflict system primase domain-containing protein n=2 Tax=Kineococcus xinjiangensis TaxID=512762 RepID=A0A2S6ICQ6_9ACTN|nr:hypothetical protein [Kineococcus xinjiangensis]PPK91953.1 hypothetical protein CLV92_11934 [Kineococcus xinjiangensis]